MNNNILQQIYCIQVTINAWSGMRKVRREDFEALGISLPPDKLVSLGCKRIIDPKLLLVFRALRQRAERFMDSIGTRFLGGWAIPRNRVDHVIDGLKQIKELYDVAIDEFLASYDTAVSEWLSSFPEWEVLLGRGLPDPAQVRRKFAFSWQVYEVNPPQVEDEGLEQEVASMPDRLYGEIAKWADTVWRESFLGKNEVTRKALRPLLRMADKLRGLSFVEPNAAKVVSLVESTLAGLPQRGKIVGAALDPLYRVLFVLSSPERMRTYGELGTLDVEGFSVFQGSALVDLGDIGDDESPDDLDMPTQETEDKLDTDASVTEAVPVGFGRWF